MLVTGGLRLLTEQYPGRFAFRQFLGGASFGWFFWLIGISGFVWLLLRAMGSSEPVSGQRCSDTDTWLTRFFRNFGVETLILLLTAACLSMLIRSGYFWDDAVNSTTYLAQKKDAIPTLRHVLDFMGEYLKLGRINVLSVYYYFFFYIENVSLYKALIILTILANQLIFRKTLLEFGVPISGARLGMLLIPTLLQTRPYQDPVSGFYGLMQVLTAEMMLCAFFLMRWFRTEKNRYLWLSLLFYGIGLMTYEVCFPFLLMVCLLILVRRRHFGRAVRESLPFIALTLLMVIAVIFVRSRYTTQGTYAGVAFSLDPERILRAALTQFCAGLPLSYYSAAYQASVLGDVYPAADILNYSFTNFLKAVRFSDILILILSIGIILKLGTGKTGQHGQNRELPVLGFSFAMLPVITVAVSERYQGQLMPGLGYLPVYMQYYGIAVLLLWITFSLRRSTGLRAVCLSAFSLMLLLNLQNNRAVTEILNRRFYEPRRSGEAALHSGMLDFLPEDAVLISLNDRRYLWEANWNNLGLYKEFYGNNSKRLPSAAGDNELLRDAVNEALSAGVQPDPDGWIMLEPDNVWVIDYYGTADQGFARLGHLRSARANSVSLELSDAEADHITYFICGPYADKTSAQYTTADGEFKQTAAEEQLRIRRSGSGILYQLPETEQIFFNSLTVFSK